MVQVGYSPCISSRKNRSWNLETSLLFLPVDREVAACLRSPNRSEGDVGRGHTTARSSVPKHRVPQTTLRPGPKTPTHPAGSLLL